MMDDDARLDFAEGEVPIGANAMAIPCPCDTGHCIITWSMLTKSWSGAADLARI